MYRLWMSLTEQVERASRRMPRIKVGTRKPNNINMRTDEKIVDWKSNAKKRRVRTVAGTTLIAIFEIYDEKSIANHLINLVRSRGVVTKYKEEKHLVHVEHNGQKFEKVVTIKVPVYQDFYYLSDEETLKAIENYREELDRDALESAIKDEDL